MRDTYKCSLCTASYRPGSCGENGVQSAGLAPVDDDLSENTLPRLLVDTLSGKESCAVHTLPALLRSELAAAAGVVRGHRAGDGDNLFATVDG